MLAEDGYRELAGGENPAPDDVVLYRHNLMGIVHVARVLEVAPLVQGGAALQIPDSSANGTTCLAKTFTR